MQHQITGAFLGIAIGDALGVPVEFKTRSYLSENSVTGMIGYGSWNQPPGTFSDDASLSFCTAESLALGYNIDHLANTFLQWYQHGYWGAHDQVFDIGNTTRLALQRIATGTSPLLAGGFEEFENGNGSLMRMMPLAFYLAAEKDINTRYQLVKEISGITHLHFRSVLACFIYVEYLRNLLTTSSDPRKAYEQIQSAVNNFVRNRQFNPTEIKHFERILQNDISAISEELILSSGYVIHTLESALWCLLTTDSYSSCVLKAVNLGGDTDTTAAVAGAAAGLHYRETGIPAQWASEVAKATAIRQLSERFGAAISTASPQ
ncbi:MAG TPA: ADP-ribosylglycohydrolase family protein [Chitinophaga sp.]|uniref:ADP-ribosylglycohydrolase family protein n=1 Tax=Chitinophaga sp. TaxID=1869181 RepID=UPI002BDC4AB3|nr:ADP-ribosylglycohydrolase family protein [Chitinophaga sp.]HVI46764.1 ADP-ribosylglycohydrolase family protein [Chitinophaga sp.]